jgi:N utilization substance protein A
VVPDYQLSLAIGKEGQNARLAAKLTNWKIDIKSETQMEAIRNPEAQKAPAVSTVEIKAADAKKTEEADSD